MTSLCRLHFLPGQQQAQPSPRLPQRHDSTSTRDSVERPVQFVPGGFHMYNINEMISLMGKRKKMPTTLGINLKTGTILIAPERAQDGPSKEWTAEKMTHYSPGGKATYSWNLSAKQKRRLPCRRQGYRRRDCCRAGRAGRSCPRRGAPRGSSWPATGHEQKGVWCCTTLWLRGTTK